MCGRYALAPGRRDAWAVARDQLGEAVAQALEALPPRYNVCPSTDVPVILHSGAEGAPLLLAARWGLVPHWWKDAQPPRFATINARSEEAAVKPLWRDAWQRQRCLVPATHWYEWQAAGGHKIPHAHAPADGSGFLFAGLWSHWRPAGGGVTRLTCAIITRDAAPALAHIHPRMPVILQPEAWHRWLTPERRPPEEIGQLLQAHAVLEAESWTVSPAVNRAGSEGPDLLRPLAWSPPGTPPPVQGLIDL